MFNGFHLRSNTKKSFSLYKYSYKFLRRTIAFILYYTSTPRPHDCACAPQGNTAALYESRDLCRKLNITSFTRRIYARTSGRPRLRIRICISDPYLNSRSSPDPERRRRGQRWNLSILIAAAVRRGGAVGCGFRRRFTLSSPRAGGCWGVVNRTFCWLLDHAAETARDLINGIRPRPLSFQ
ncbi:hypothetical protein EVAR_57415_1 [Eumeta japonica]|uniref:Uncharacterized protein n=1 Tax=Eumeta variegata TaxID=151549 RepID=A0A4C1ZZ38_EUMVA|nr:hypothetical protein EVAR_57415_1 [Eumeta japonica]